MQQFDEVARAVDEDEDRAAAGIVAEARDDQGMQAVEGLAHVAGFEREEDAQAAGECQHGRRRFDRSSTASGRAAREASSMTVPQGRTMRSAADGFAVAGPSNRISAKAGPGAADEDRALPALAQPGDEGLVMDAMLAAEAHGAHAAAGEGVQQFLALGGRDSGGGRRCRCG